MIITQKEDRPTDVIVEILCDSCGLTCCKAENHIQGPECPAHPYHSFEKIVLSGHWGYYSGKDCEAHDVILCEPCYDKMLDLMKIKPTITHYL